MGKRDYAISFVRFFSTLLIICCHCFEWLGYTLGISTGLGVLGNYCAVGVQIFLFLSGYLYGRRGDLLDNYATRIKFISNNFLKILVEYYIYVLLFVFPIYICLKPTELSLRKIWEVLTCSGTIWGVHHLWFIPYIMLAYLLTPLLFDVKKYILSKCSTDRQRIVAIISCTFVAVVLIEALASAFNSYFIAAWINCYVAGFFVSSLDDILDLKRKQCIVIILVMVSGCLNVAVFYVRYTLLETYQTGIISKLCGLFVDYARCIFAVAIFGFIVFCVRDRFSKNIVCRKVLEWSDRYSYSIYLTHMIYVKGVLSVFGLTGVVAIDFALMIILTLLSALVLYKVCACFRKWGRKIWRNQNEIFNHNSLL